MNRIIFLICSFALAMYIAFYGCGQTILPPVDTPPILISPIKVSSEATGLGSLYRQPGGSSGGADHSGIDIRFVDGGKVCSSAYGLVTLVEDNRDNYGPTKVVKIEHNRKYSTIYVFEPLKELSINANDIVQSGQLIGTVGTRELQGALHFAVSTPPDNLYNDPMTFLDAGGRALFRYLYSLATVEGLIDPCYEHTNANGYPNGCPSLHGVP